MEGDIVSYSFFESLLQLAFNAQEEHEAFLSKLDHFFKAGHTAMLVVGVPLESSNGILMAILQKLFW